MSPAISLQSQDEPIIPVVIHDREYPFMVDTGATYSCIGKEGSRFPLSTSSIKTIGFSGKSQVIPLTEPVPMLIAGKVICTPLLYSAHTPVNLLGRDILCPLKAKIMCTQDGLYLDFPDEPPQHMMSQLPQDVTEKQQALAYWLRLTPEESHLQQKWTEWEEWIRMHYDTAHTSTLPLHCTLMYDKDQTHVDYQECWDAVINKKPCLITSEDTFMGLEGVAAAVRLPEDLSGWYQVPTSHVTLLVAKGYESHHLGPMVRRALQVQEWVPTKNKYIHISKDKQFIRISVKVGDEAIADKVMVDGNTPTQMAVATEHEEMLNQVPPQLWTAHKTDVGLIKSAQPVHIKLKPHVNLPYQKQYPLKQHAIDGIRPTIKGLVEAGVLVKTKSPCNTPIFPIRKPNSTDYRLFHDLRAVNAVVDGEIPHVPDPHTLLSNIPPDTQWYTVIDLCSAFFSVPLHPDSQYLFAFMYKNQQYTYSRLAQGFLDSPSIFNRVLTQDLASLNVRSTVLQYVDDLLICSLTKEQCEKDSIAVLTTLAEGGHKVSNNKLQFCQQSVEYLRRRLCGDKRCIAPSQVEAIIKAMCVPS
uniref:uncharacterized protein LOC117264429 isoform X1 n=1 Tax=Epinephelus lanceolatus TaxID=310571 RepID=UPI001448485D|nr:uncharacterized protein LOC117264429 isoform X1 [Epinephelus lanceolatus]